MGRVLVAGAGGFIGGHLVGRLLRDGHDVRAVDIKPLDDWQQSYKDSDALRLDLRERDACIEAVRGCEVVFDLAADMGGMGFISSHRADCMLSVLIDTHLLLAARDAAVTRFFYASSACVYPSYRQDDAEVVPLRESDAYPAMPEDGYGWEKLFGERLCRHFLEDFGLETRVARFHNVYGPHGTYEGGREKAPAALCRKVAEAVADGRGELEIWGDGQQTRSFIYIDDAIEGLLRLTWSGLAEPLNIGSEQLVTIDELARMVESIAGVRLEHRYLPDAPQGVRGRNSDNTLARELLGWEPRIALAEGMARTYAWVAEKVSGGVAPYHGQG